MTKFFTIVFCFITFLASAQVNLTNGLVAYYPFSGNAGDSSGNNYHGTVNGATLTTDKNGNSNSAYAFDENLGIKIDTMTASGWPGITYSVWIQTTKTSPQMQVLQSSASGVLYINWIKTGHFMAAFDGTGNNNSSTDISATDVTDGKWHHIAASNDGNTTRVYVDGVLEATYSETLSTSTGAFNIAGTGWPFVGKMDEVRVYKRAVTDAEVAALAGLTPTGIENEDLNAGKSIKVYPNPNYSNNVTIELPASVNTNTILRIYDVSGKLLHSENVKANQTRVNVNTSAFEKGTYIVNVTTPEGIFTEKLILQ